MDFILHVLWMDVLHYCLHTPAYFYVEIFGQAYKCYLQIKLKQKDVAPEGQG